MEDPKLPAQLDAFTQDALAESADETLIALRLRYNAARDDLGSEALTLLADWPGRLEGITAEKYSYKVRDRIIEGENYRESLSNQQIPKIAPPRIKGWGDLLRFLMKENLPGSYPYTGGVYPYRRAGEDPTRMFAGEGMPERTNRRFHYLSHGHAPSVYRQRSTRLPFTGKTHTNVPISMARSETRVFPSRQSMTQRNFTRASTCVCRQPLYQ